MEDERKAVKQALESHNLLIFGLCCTGKNVSFTVRQLYLYFDTIVTLLTLNSVRSQVVVADALGMKSSAAR